MRLLLAVLLEGVPRPLAVSSPESESNKNGIPAFSVAREGFAGVIRACFMVLGFAPRLAISRHLRPNH
jgi:hypothetical protein